MNHSEQMLREALQGLHDAMACYDSTPEEILALAAAKQALAATPEPAHELCPSCRNSDIYACTCPFKTARNSQPECFEPAKLVRLTEDEVACLYYEAHGKAVCEIDYKDAFNKAFANAIMNAMIAKNGGKV